MWPIVAGVLATLTACLVLALAHRLRLAGAQREALDAATLSITGDLTPEAVWQTLANAARTLVSADACAVGILPEVGGPPRFVTAGIPAEVSVGMNCLQDVTGVRGLVLRTGRPVRLRNVREHPAFAGFPEGHLPVRALLGVPILSQGRVLGAIYLARQNSFSPADEAQIVRLARHATAAVVNARLFREVSRARDGLERLISASGDAVATLDAGGWVLQWNAGARALYGLTAEAARREPLPFVALTHRPEGLELLKRVTTGSPVEDLEVTHCRADGTPVPVLLSLSSAPAGDGAAPEVLMIARDLTARKREETRRQRLALLEVRDRISMDLHDGTIQHLYGLGLRLGALRRELSDKPSQELAGAIGELNRVIQDLRAYILDQGAPRYAGLAAGMEELAATMQECAASLDLQIETDPPPEVADQLIRIAGEALANVRRHSGAHQITIAVRATASAVDLTIEDDGCGFDVAVVMAKGRLGLRNMQARAQALGGACRIETEPGHGTRVAVQVPLEGEAVSWGSSPFR